MSMNFRFLVNNIFFVSIIALFSCNTNETSSHKSDSIEISPADTLNQNFDYSFPSELIYQPKTDELLIDAFYPVGWSKDGLFAYISIPADEASGYYYFTFNIINANTGKTEWTWIIDEKNAQEEGSLKDTWEKNKKLFTSTLKKYKIIQNNTIKIENFPLLLNSVPYTIKLNIKYSEDTFGYGFDVVGKFSAHLITPQGFDKEIFSKDYQNNMILNLTLVGYIKNPFENDVFVLFKTTRMGYEGPPNVVSFDFTVSKIE